MTHGRGHFEGKNGARIYYQYWLPKNQPKAAIVICHGLAEHGGRYKNVVDYFVPLGYAIYAADHIGHGRSEGRRTYVEAFYDYVDTLQKFLLNKDLPSFPPKAFLLGHSMGALIAAVYVLKHPNNFNGAIFSGPAFKVPKTISPLTLILGEWVACFFPKVGLVKIRADFLCRDPCIVREYLRDPLVYNGRATAKLLWEIVKTTASVRESAFKIELPVLILQGAADKLVDPEGATEIYDTINSKHKTIKTYSGLYHEIFNEPEKQIVLEDVRTWLESFLDC